MEISNKNTQNNNSNNGSSSYAPEFDDWLNAPSKVGNWINLKAEQSIMLVFNPTKKSVVTKPFKRKVKREDGQIVEETKDVQRAEYIVTKPDDPTNTEYTYEASKRHAKQLEGFFRDGFVELKITRHGLGTDTYYDVIPVIKKQQRQPQQKLQAAA